MATYEPFYGRTMELPDELLVGAIDSHVHAGPVLRSNPGHFDPIQVAQMARDAGLRSILYYDVFGWASGTAWMVNRYMKDFRTYGGYLMNSCHDGMNPRAVRTALNLGDGCRMISFGSHCTHHSAMAESAFVDGELVPFKDAIPGFRERELERAIRIPLDGPVPDALKEILDMVAERPEVYLNTGHVSGPEALRIVELAQAAGIEKVLVAHPARTLLSVDEQKSLAQKGVFLEACAVDFGGPAMPHTHYYVERELMDMHSVVHGKAMRWLQGIRDVGPEQFVLATDYGIRVLPSPIEGMRMMISMLLYFGFSIEEVRLMTATNPARLIGME
ncbi:DUF6282 family protein [Qingshengfaniella alkalisoli]|uniref:Amidohydrolase-related domain-containing protein n=1 Tax=Qingshengfaniella alkalisoli TaxID=2599296 RepID=A0A5B8J0X2_9RHOB|nr:DUF6282 family protein [Qingshengfaniella alkalisoli]QDY70528.1 hypothetical protein FPZ52_12545 [Qingshengfaniella alkalisoli]